MSKIASATLAPEAAPAIEPQRVLSFECKCGCDMFRVNVLTNIDHSWFVQIECAACGTSCVPTEPITNGPH
jgi:hypothetical protein